MVSDDDVLVVDANLTPASAEASIAALRKLTAKPVRYLVNTHRHHDHVGGNEVYRREFPGIEIVGHAAMRDDLEASGKSNDGRLDGLGGGDGGRHPEAPRERHRSLRRTALRRGTHQPRSRPRGGAGAGRRRTAHARRHADPDGDRPADAAPVSDESAHDRDRGARQGAYAWRPRGLAAGGEIAATGDLLVAPVPLVGGDQSYVEEWLETLGRLQALGAAIYLPGHGAVQRGDAQLVLYRDFLGSVIEQTRAAMAKGLSADEAAGAIDVASFRDRMAGESPVLRMLFSNWGRVPAVTALYRLRDEAKSATP